ncbi:MAG: oxidoreductase [Proteobacteria bacterium]|nr:oxidoreductase [Pseudomonadota bacterium]
MQRRHLLKLVAATALLALGSLTAQAQQPAYQAVNPPQPGGINGQIEVIEFFSYACPHCDHFDPMLAKWRGEQAKDVVFKRVPVSFGRPEWAALGRLYLTLNTLGLSDKLDRAVFDAVQRGNVRLDDEKTRNEWLTKQGVDVRKFNDTWRSFSVDSLAKRAEQQSAAYKVMGVPSLAINGKFILEGGDPQALQTASSLVSRERKGAAPATASPQPAAKKPAGK